MSHERGQDVSIRPTSADPEELYDAIIGILRRLDSIQSIHGWFLRRYVAARTVPTVNDQEIVLWNDTANTKFYLVANFDGTTKQIELT